MTTTSTTGSNVSLIVLGGLICLAIVVVVVIVPFFTRFGATLEALSILLEGLGEYFGNPRIVWLGCLIVSLTIIGCCIIAIIGGSALLTCFSNNPVPLCRLIGH